MARLEARVELRLLHRTARAVALTEEDRRFYDAVASPLSAIEQAAAVARGSAGEVRGRLRVNVDEAVGPLLLAPHIRPFLDLHPALSVELAVRDRLGDLVADGFDLAIRFGLPARSPKTCRLLLETPVLTCASPDYVARHGDPAHPSELERSHQCVLLRDGEARRTFEWEFIGRGERVAVAAAGQLTVDGTGALLGACLGGQGVAQLLGIYAAPFLNDGRLVQLLPAWADESFPLHAYGQTAPFSAPKVRVFTDYVADLLATLSSAPNTAASAGDEKVPRKR